MKNSHKYWKIFDPDNLLGRSYDELDLMEFNGFVCKEVVPREDLFQAKNKNSGLVLDLGYYEEGTWTLSLVGADLDWQNPVEKNTFISLAEAVEELKVKLGR